MLVVLVVTGVDGEEPFVSMVEGQGPVSFFIPEVIRRAHMYGIDPHYLIDQINRCMLQYWYDTHRRNDLWSTRYTHNSVIYTLNRTFGQGKIFKFCGLVVR